MLGKNKGNKFWKISSNFSYFSDLVACHMWFFCGIKTICNQSRRVLMKSKWQTVVADKSRWLVKNVLQACFRVSIKGHYKSGDKAVIIANRTSVLDVMFLSVFLPEKLTLVLPPNLYKKLWVKALALFAEVIPVDPTKASAARVLIRATNEGKRCLIFPQGLSSQPDHSLRVFDGPGLIIQKVGGLVQPVRISGLEKSIFSIAKQKHLLRLFPKVTLNIQQQVTFYEKDGQRRAVGRKLFNLISEMTFANCNVRQSMFSALIEGVHIGCKNKAHIEDTNRTPISYRQMLTRCFILGRQLKNQTQPYERVGLMMPTTCAGMITFFALQAYRRIPTMINFSSGFYNIYSACRTANIKTIYTARQFIETAKLEHLVNALKQSDIEIMYLEDFKPNVGLPQKIAGLVKAYFPRIAYRAIGRSVEATDTCVILFTSGSEGVPKGVVLSHSNILSNCYQMMSRVDFSTRDVFFNSLPIFHCFGLTAGSILPMVTGNNTFFYPSPLHYKIIPGLVYEAGATIMFATDTFLLGYARAAANHEFTSIRYIFAGAEKVKPETINHWASHFGSRIFEGYGATEAAPVIALNCPMAHRNRSVGQVLPMIDIRIEPVEGICHGGRLFIRGPNVMRGYMRADNPGQIEALTNGWYDTGDIVELDDDGFITISGRAKRFAKLGGEMVSLTTVESVTSSIWPENLHAAIAVACPRKGEKIILYSECESTSRSEFMQYVKMHGHTELLNPSAIISGVTIPVLASGKIDYIKLQQNHEQAAAEKPVTVGA